MSVANTGGLSDRSEESTFRPAKRLPHLFHGLGFFIQAGETVVYPFINIIKSHHGATYRQPHANAVTHILVNLPASYPADYVQRIDSYPRHSWREWDDLKDREWTTMELGRHFGRMEGTATPNIEGKVVLRLEWLKECIDAGKVFGPECGYRGWEVRGSYDPRLYHDPPLLTRIVPLGNSPSSSRKQPAALAVESGQYRPRSPSWSDAEPYRRVRRREGDHYEPARDSRSPAKPIRPAYVPRQSQQPILNGNGDDTRPLRPLSPEEKNTKPSDTYALSSKPQAQDNSHLPTPPLTGASPVLTIAGPITSRLFSVDDGEVQVRIAEQETITFAEAIGGVGEAGGYEGDTGIENRVLQGAANISLESERSVSEQSSSAPSKSSNDSSSKVKKESNETDYLEELVDSHSSSSTSTEEETANDSVAASHTQVIPYRSSPQEIFSTPHGIPLSFHIPGQTGSDKALKLLIQMSGGILAPPDQAIYTVLPLSVGVLLADPVHVDLVKRAEKEGWRAVISVDWVTESLERGEQVDHRGFLMGLERAEVPPTPDSIGTETQRGDWGKRTGRNT